jgi:hypothetical protein
VNWYSTCVRRICLIEGLGAIRCEDDVSLLSADGWEEARQKAILLGRSREETYLNSDGQRVRWAFDRLITLDCIGDIHDGVEIYSQSAEIGDPSVSYDHEFHPEAVDPTQSV